MDMPQKLLADLRCTECDQFLSRSPVYVRPDGSSICHRCVCPKLNATRNKSYEAAAKLLKFPCTYHSLGCRKCVSFISEGDNETHEDYCEYRQFSCLIMGSEICNWTGTRSELVKHCHECHSSRCVTNPCHMSLDVNKFGEYNFIISDFDQTFLLSVKVCVDTGRIYHGIRCVTDPQMASKFYFSLQVKRNSSFIMKEGEVTSCISPTLDDSLCIVLSIGSLQDFFDGLKGNVFTVTIKQKNCGCVENEADSNNSQLSGNGTAYGGSDKSILQATRDVEEDARTCTCIMAEVTSDSFKLQDEMVEEKTGEGKIHESGPESIQISNDGYNNNRKKKANSTESNKYISGAFDSSIDIDSTENRSSQKKEFLNMQLTDRNGKMGLSRLNGPYKIHSKITEKNFKSEENFLVKVYHDESLNKYVHNMNSREKNHQATRKQQEQAVFDCCEEREVFNDYNECSPINKIMIKGDTCCVNGRFQQEYEQINLNLFEDNELPGSVDRDMNLLICGKSAILEPIEEATVEAISEPIAFSILLANTNDFNESQDVTVHITVEHKLPEQYNRTNRGTKMELTNHETVLQTAALELKSKSEFLDHKDMDNSGPDSMDIQSEHIDFSSESNEYNSRIRRCLFNDDIQYQFIADTETFRPNVINNREIENKYNEGIIDIRPVDSTNQIIQLKLRKLISNQIAEQVKLMQSLTEAEKYEDEGNMNFIQIDSTNNLIMLMLQEEIPGEIVTQLERIETILSNHNKNNSDSIVELTRINNKKYFITLRLQNSISSDVMKQLYLVDSIFSGEVISNIIKNPRKAANSKKTEQIQEYLNQDRIGAYNFDRQKAGANKKSNGPYGITKKLDNNSPELRNTTPVTNRDHSVSNKNQNWDNEAPNDRKDHIFPNCSILSSSSYEMRVSDLEVNPTDIPITKEDSIWEQEKRKINNHHKKTDIEFKIESNNNQIVDESKNYSKNENNLKKVQMNKDSGTIHENRGFDLTASEVGRSINENDKDQEGLNYIIFDNEMQLTQSYDEKPKFLYKNSKYSDTETEHGQDHTSIIDGNDFEETFLTSNESSQVIDDVRQEYHKEYMNKYQQQSIGNESIRPYLEEEYKTLVNTEIGVRNPFKSTKVEKERDELGNKNCFKLSNKKVQENKFHQIHMKTNKTQPQLTVYMDKRRQSNREEKRTSTEIEKSEQIFNGSIPKGLKKQDTLISNKRRQSPVNEGIKHVIDKEIAQSEEYQNKDTEVSVENSFNVPGGAKVQESLAQEDKTRKQYQKHPIAQKNLSFNDETSDNKHISVDDSFIGYEKLPLTDTNCETYMTKIFTPKVNTETEEKSRYINSVKEKNYSQEKFTGLSRSADENGERPSKSQGYRFDKVENKDCSKEEFEQPKNAPVQEKIENISGLNERYGHQLIDENRTISEKNYCDGIQQPEHENIGNKFDLSGQTSIRSGLRQSKSDVIRKELDEEYDYNGKFHTQPEEGERGKIREGVDDLNHQWLLTDGNGIHSTENHFGETKNGLIVQEYIYHKNNRPQSATGNSSRSTKSCKKQHVTQVMQKFPDNSESLRLSTDRNLDRSVRNEKAMRQDYNQDNQVDKIQQSPRKTVRKSDVKNNNLQLTQTKDSYSKNNVFKRRKSDKKIGGENRTQQNYIEESIIEDERRSTGKDNDSEISLERVRRTLDSKQQTGKDILDQNVIAEIRERLAYGINEQLELNQNVNSEINSSFLQCLEHKEDVSSVEKEANTKPEVGDQKLLGKDEKVEYDNRRLPENPIMNNDTRIWEEYRFKPLESKKFYHKMDGANEKYSKQSTNDAYNEEVRQYIKLLGEMDLGRTQELHVINEYLRQRLIIDKCRKICLKSIYNDSAVDGDNLQCRLPLANESVRETDYKIDNENYSVPFTELTEESKKKRQTSVTSKKIEHEEKDNMYSETDQYNQKNSIIGEQEYESSDRPKIQSNQDQIRSVRRSHSKKDEHKESFKNAERDRFITEMMQVRVEDGISMNSQEENKIIEREKQAEQNGPEKIYHNDKSPLESPNGKNITQSLNDNTQLIFEKKYSSLNGRVSRRSGKNFDKNFLRRNEEKAAIENKYGRKLSMDGNFETNGNKSQLCKKCCRKQLLAETEFSRGKSHRLQSKKLQCRSPIIAETSTSRNHGASTQKIIQIERKHIFLMPSNCPECVKVVQILDKRSEIDEIRLTKDIISKVEEKFHLQAVSEEKLHDEKLISRKNQHKTTNDDQKIQAVLNDSIGNSKSAEIDLDNKPKLRHESKYKNKTSATEDKTSAEHDLRSLPRDHEEQVEFTDRIRASEIEEGIFRNDFESRQEYTNKNGNSAAEKKIQIEHDQRLTSKHQEEKVEIVDSKNLNLGEGNKDASDEIIRNIKYPQDQKLASKDQGIQVELSNLRNELVTRETNLQNKPSPSKKLQNETVSNTEVSVFASSSNAQIDSTRDGSELEIGSRDEHFFDLKKNVSPHIKSERRICKELGQKYRLYSYVREPRNMNHACCTYKKNTASCDNHFFVETPIGTVLYWYSRKYRKFLVNLYTTLSSGKLKNVSLKIKCDGRTYRVYGDDINVYKIESTKLLAEE